MRYSGSGLCVSFDRDGGNAPPGRTGRRKMRPHAAHGFHGVCDDTRLPSASFESTLAALFAQQPVEKVRRGAHLFWEGDRADDVFCIDDGILRKYKLLCDGRRVITDFRFRREIAGFTAGETCHCSAEAMTTLQVRRLSRDILRRYMRASQDLWGAFLERLCDDIAAAERHVVLLARKSAEERVCSLLLLLLRRTVPAPPAHPRIELPMSRIDMADYLGLTVETVSRIMTRLTARGVVAPQGRHALTVRRLPLLISLAGEEEMQSDAAE